MKKILTILLATLYLACLGQAGFRTILPAQAGHSGEFLQTNGIGLSWAAVSSGDSAAGSQGDVQFNLNGLLSGGGPVYSSPTLSVRQADSTGKVLTNNLAFTSTGIGQLIIKRGSTASNSTVTWTLPPAQGAAGTVLTNNGSGVLSWSAGSVTIPNGRVPFGSSSNTVTSDTGIGFSSMAGFPILRVFVPGVAGEIKTGDIAFGNSANSNVVTFSANSATATYGIVLPPIQGAANTYPKNNGSGVLSWTTGALPAVKDTLSDLVTGTVTLINNSRNTIVASAAITATTFAFPTGADQDIIIINNTRVITTLTVSGTNTGTITAVKIANAALAGCTEFDCIGGNWY